MTYEKAMKTFRRILTEARDGREIIANVLKGSRHEMSTETIARTEAAISQLDRIICYATGAIASLPDDPEDRLRALGELFSVVVLLTDDSVTH